MIAVLAALLLTACGPTRVVVEGTFPDARFDYSLDAVAREVLGEGKTLTGKGRADEILLDKLRSGKLEVTTDISDDLLQSVDILRELQVVLDVAAH